MVSRASRQSGPKRNSTQRDRDRSKVAHWHALGYSLREITDKLDEETKAEGYQVNRITVGRDLRSVLEEWRASRIKEIQLRRMQQQSQIDYVIREAVQAYEGSKTKRRESVARRVDKLAAEQNILLMLCDQCAESRGLAELGPDGYHPVDTVAGVQVGCFPDLYNALSGNPPDQVITL